MFKKKKELKALYKVSAALSGLAMLDSLYLVYMHFKPSQYELCTFGESFDCDIVNKSIYAEFLDVPVSIWGLLTYALLFAFFIYAWKQPKEKLTKKLLPYVLAFVAFGVVFSLRLTYIEAFVLYAWCIFCVIQQILILLLLGTVWMAYKTQED